jgi:Uma2 family endonuclease
MANSRNRPATYADLYDVPENQVGEIIDGELFATPRPAVPHAIAGTALGGLLFDPYRRGIGGPGGWIILYEPELHFRDDVLVPDFAGWRRERFSSVPKGTVGIEVVPDWVCEILSPSTARLDRARKLPLYARERAAHAWFIDPIAQTLEVMRLDGERWTLLATFAGDARVKAEPFDAIELDLAALWTL